MSKKLVLMIFGGLLVGTGIAFGIKLALNNREETADVVTIDTQLAKDFSAELDKALNNEELDDAIAEELSDGDAE